MHSPAVGHKNKRVGSLAAIVAALYNSNRTRISLLRAPCEETGELCSVIVGGVVAVVSRGVSTQSTPHACPASHAACTCRSTSTTRETSVRLCGLDEQRTLAAQLLGPSLLHLIKASATTKREGPEMFGRTSPVALEGSRGTDNIS